MDYRQIRHNSEDYHKMIDLRVRALLAPIGIPGSYIVPGEEANDLFLGGFEGDQIVACCILTDVGNGVAKLRQMAVAPEKQGENIGAGLLSFAEKQAAVNGFRKIELNARKPVTGFYLKGGYLIEGDEFLEVNMPHYRMIKEL